MSRNAYKVAGIHSCLLLLLVDRSRPVSID
jgi:hypothetical protein